MELFTVVEKAFFTFTCRLICLAFSFLSINFTAKAQFFFNTISLSDGLSQSSIQSILKDSDGYMWFTSEEGLNKFDGYRFTIYKQNIKNKKTIASNRTNTVYEDGDKNLWIGTYNGLSFYDRKSDSFLNYKDHSQLSATASFNVLSIFEDYRKRFWIGTANGLKLFDKHNRIFTSVNINANEKQIIYQIHQDKNKDLWLVTNKGTYIKEHSSEMIQPLQKYLKFKQNSPVPTIRAITEDTIGNLYFASYKGLYSLNLKEKVLMPILPELSTLDNEEVINCLKFSSNGQLWVGTSNSLRMINLKSDETFKFVHDPATQHGLSDNIILSLYEDNQKILWIGTKGGGVNLYNQSQAFFPHFSPKNQAPTCRYIRNITKDINQVYWIGTDGGLLSFNRQNKRFTLFPCHSREDNDPKVKEIDAVLPSKKNNHLWVGSHHGLYLFDPGKNHWRHVITPEEKSGEKIYFYALLEDQDGSIWGGTNKGLFCLNTTTMEFNHYYKEHEQNFEGKLIYSLCEDKDGNVWIATDNSGVAMFSRTKRTFEYYNLENCDISSNEISFVTKDHLGNIWIGTMNSGLNVYNPYSKAFHLYDEENGLVNNVVNYVTEDKKGYIWISTNKGITRLDTRDNSFRNYGLLNGLQAYEFNVGAGYQNESGELFFGGVNGFNIINPVDIPENKAIPPVVINGFFLRGHQKANETQSELKGHLYENSQINLPYNQRDFSVEFAALDYTSSGKNHYAYMLKGFDTGWTHIGTNHTASFTNLSPGEYLFKVKASNNDGWWNEDGTSLKIIIATPFWLTWWFKTIVGISSLGIILLIFKLRMNNIKNQKKLLEEQVKQQTTQLLHTNEELELKNKELEQFAYVASHDLQEPLRTTSSFIGLLHQQYKGKLDEKGEKYFMFISQASERMKVLIKDLLEYSRIGRQKNRQEINCSKVVEEVVADLGLAIREAQADISWEPLPTVPGYYTELKQLFQNLIANAIKFRKKDTVPKVTISATEQGNYWKFKVSDNGIGIESQHLEKIFVIFQRLHARNEYPGSGIGLANCKKIVELHKGKIWVESTPDNGSAFHFTIQREDTGK